MCSWMWRLSSLLMAQQLSELQSALFLTMRKCFMLQGLTQFWGAINWVSHSSLHLQNNPSKLAPGSTQLLSSRFDSVCCCDPVYGCVTLGLKGDVPSGATNYQISLVVCWNLLETEANDGPNTVILFWHGQSASRKETQLCVYGVCGT